MTSDMGTCLTSMSPKIRADLGGGGGPVDSLHRQRPQGLTDLCHLHRDSLAALTIPDSLTTQVDGGQSQSGDSLSSSDQDVVYELDQTRSAESVFTEDGRTASSNSMGEGSALENELKSTTKRRDGRTSSRYRDVLGEFDAADDGVSSSVQAVTSQASMSLRKTGSDCKLTENIASSCKKTSENLVSSSNSKSGDKTLPLCCGASKSSDKGGRSSKTDQRSSPSSSSKGGSVCEADLRALVNSAFQEGRTLLHNAAHQGDVKMVSRLLHCGAKVNARDNTRRTPLHEVAEMGHVSVAKLLLEKGAKVNVRDKWKCTPLHQAVAWKQARMVQLLLQYDAKATGGTLLQDVMNMDVIKEDVIIKLIQRGADVNATDMTGQTPMHTAVKYGRLHIVWLLMEAGADLNKVSRGMMDRNHANALTNARHQLLPLGMAHLLQDGWSPLRMAQKYKHFDLVVWLVNCGANIVVCDSTGRFPHHKATTQRNCPSLHHVLAHPNCPIDIRDVDDKTAIKLNFEAHAKSMVDSNPQCGCCSNQPGHTEGPSCDEYTNTSILLLQHGAEVCDLYIYDYDLLRHLCSGMFMYDVRLLQAVLLSGNDLSKLLTSAQACLRDLRRQQRHDMLEWLDDFVHSPRTLRDQCRIRVRSLLRQRRRRRSIWTAITSLPLPNALMDFLLLQELQGARLTRHFLTCRPSPRTPTGIFRPQPQLPYPPELPGLLHQTV